MNTGRNLTALSVGIIIYLLSGAEFQSAGVGGVSWDIKYPEVIKAAAVLFLLWLVLLHWLTRKEGHYYRAWCDNAMHHHHGPVGEVGHNRPSEVVVAEIEETEKYFGTEFTRKEPAKRYGFLYLNNEQNPAGVYIVAASRIQGKEVPGDASQNEVFWHPNPLSKRIPFRELVVKYNDVAIHVLANNPEIISRRIIPWLLAVVALTAIVANQFVDVSQLSGHLFDRCGAC